MSNAEVIDDVEPLPESIGECGGPDVGKRRRFCCGLFSGLRHAKSEWPILVAGQILSFIFAASGAVQATLSFVCGLSAPAFTIGLFYFCMAFFLIPVYRTTRLNKKTKEISQHLELASASSEQTDQNNENSKTFSFFFGCFDLCAPAKIYLLMAVLDVYANFFTVLALHYTTITSVTLLDALAIPSAMILSRCFLKRKYSLLHLLGAILCMVGVIMNVFLDYEHDLKYKAKHHGDVHDALEEEFPYQAQGNMMAVAGGVLFGASSVVGETIVHHNAGPNEYVGMLGLFAAIICMVQTLIFETDDLSIFLSREVEIEDTCSKSTTQILIAAFVVINVLNYLGRAWFLQVSEAAFLNLSLLTGDMWSVMFSVAAEKVFPQPLFYGALFVTLSGVFVYEMADSPVMESQYHSKPFGDSVSEDSSDHDCENESETLASND